MQLATSTTRNLGFGTNWAGQSVDGRFLLEKYLGGSRTSAVFLTRIGGPEGARAAIKLVLASSCDADAQLALWRGAARLSHPNLIRILDGGRCWLAGNDLIFVVMEYAEENLGEVLPRRALTPAEGYAMLRPIVEALKYLHGQGLVHSHLRPSNVMAVNEELKISSDAVRLPGEFKSSPDLSIHDLSIYDAPELGTGTISPASDVWSLSAVLTEALTPKSTRQTAAYIGLPRPFSEIVQHCLRDEPSARWTLSDIETHLQASAVARPGAPTRSAEAHPATRLKETEPGPHVRRYLPLALAAVLLLILAAIYGVVHSRTGPQTPASHTPSTSASTEPSATPAPSSGEVLKQVSPNASTNALHTIHGRIKVRVRVGVDSSGNVQNAKLTTPGPSKYFARLAMQAAQQWKFTAPKANGQPVASEWTILFEFTHSGISQQATQTK